MHFQSYTITRLIMTCFLAIQGFQLENTFIFKEIAVLSEHSDIFHVWSLQPPCRIFHLSALDKQIVKLNSNGQLGLLWDDGMIAYKYLPSIFETIAREFKLWYVEDVCTEKRIHPFKS